MKLMKLSGNQLKIIAAVAMLIDHIGLIFFPSVAIFRIIGRLAFPAFAFMISEGARYTKNKTRYFLSIFLLGIFCQAVYFFGGGLEPLNILITFSFSIIIIYIMQSFKQKLFSDGVKKEEKAFWCIIFFLLVASVYYITIFVHVDYGFFGIMTPVAASLLDFQGIDAPEKYKRADTVTARVLCLAIPIIIMIIRGFDNVRPFMIFAIPILLLYSGKRGKTKLKYFFYVFYPLHLAMLEGIYILTRIL